MKKTSFNKPPISGIVFGMAMVLSASAAVADDIPNPTPNKQKTAVDCSQYKLTGKQLIKAVKAIAEHGDLTDIPFIEKTLGVKFESRNVIQDVYNDRMLYEAKSIFGAPVKASVDVNFDPAQQKKSGLVGIMRIDGTQENYIPMCLHITSKEFEAVYGHKFPIPSFGTDGSEFSGLSENTSATGKNLRTSFSYNTKSGVIRYMSIKQFLNN